MEANLETLSVGLYGCDFREKFAYMVRKCCLLSNVSVFPVVKGMRKQFFFFWEALIKFKERANVLSGAKAHVDLLHLRHD
jgi:hypothetical protein